MEPAPTSWAITPTTVAFTHRPLMRISCPSSSSRPVAHMVSVPRTVAASATSTSKRSSQPSVTATSGAPPDDGSRPSSTVTGRRDGRPRSTPTRPETKGSPPLGRSGRMTKASARCTTSTASTPSIASMRSTSAASMGRSRPSSGLSSSRSAALPAAGVTLMPDSGPPEESCSSTRVWAVEAMARSAVRRAAARATATTVSAERPSRRRTLRPASTSASRHVMGSGSPGRGHRRGGSGEAPGRRRRGRG